MSNARGYKKRFRSTVVTETGKVGEIGGRISERIAITFVGEDSTRLEDDKPALKLAEEIENAGASVLIVHGRTKEQRYTKSANWNLIGEIKSRSKIPIIEAGHFNVVRGER